MVFRGWVFFGRGKDEFLGKVAKRFIVFFVLLVISEKVDGFKGEEFGGV